MKIWLDQNREKTLRGIILFVLALITATLLLTNRAVSRLLEENAELRVSITRHDSIIDMAIAEMSGENVRLSGKITSLDAALSAAVKKIERLERAASGYEDLGDVADSAAALPALPDAPSTIAVKISDMSSVFSMASSVSRALEAISPELSADAADVIAIAETAREFAGTTREMSLLVAPSNNPAFYLSFVVDGDAFDKFMSRVRLPEPLRLEKQDGGRWALYADGKGDPALRIRKFAAGERTLELAARDANAISAMASAAGGGAPGFDAGRVTKGTDYYQVKFRDGLKVRDLMDAFSFDRTTREMMKLTYGDPEKVLWSVQECSWTRDGDTVSMDTYSDIFKHNPEMLSKRRASGEAAIYGEGELAYYLSADVGFILRCIFIGVSDPVSAIVKNIGRSAFDRLPESDIRKIVESGRISLVCVADGNKISTAYMMLETDAADALDKLYLIANFMDGSSATIDGWTNAMTWPAPYPEGFPNVFAARNDSAFIVGLGSERAYAKKLPVPESYRDYVSNDNVMSNVMSSKLVDVAAGILDVELKRSNLDDDPEVKSIRASIMAFGDSFDAVCGKISQNDRGSGKIVLKDGGDPFGAFLNIATTLASVNSANPGRSYGAEGTKIIYDLRNLKSASLLFYGDNLRWPTQSDASELDKYSDRPIVSTDKYERVIIGPEFTDERGNTRVNIGVTLGKHNSSANIRRKLESAAAETGLLNAPDSLEPYKKESMTVFMNMR
jgi:hypothetical protein